MKERDLMAAGVSDNTRFLLVAGQAKQLADEARFQIMSAQDLITFTSRLLAERRI